MVLGWRRAFCTSVSKDRESKELHKEKQQDQSTTTSSNPSPRFGSRFRFFSNPSTPRLQSQLVPPSPSLRCRTSATVATPPDQSPKLQCKTKNSPRFFFSRSSTPLSSPRSPSTFSLLKSTLRLSRVRCGICLQSVKAGEGKAIFTAECSHVFHFPCIASHLKKPDSLVCPVCGYHWKQLPILTSHQNNHHHHQKPDLKESAVPAVDARTKKNSNERKQQYPTTRPDLNLKVYNDDEPLMSPKSVTRFYPIPESDENEDDDDDDESGIGIEEDFRGFFVNPNNASPVKQQQALGCGNVEVMLLPDAAVVSVGRSHETYAVVLKVRAPPAPAKNARRVPIDLVTVLDVGGNMSAEKVQMLKRAMRLVVSSLSSSDRLSIVAFAATSKRLLPLRRMTANGRVSARRIIDAIVSTQNETIASSAGDAVKKAAKVLEDRRERNPVASILLLSQSQTQSEKTSTRVKSITTRFAHLEIPVHSVEFGQGCSGAYNSDDAFAKCVDGLLSVVVQDLRLQLGFLSGSSPVEISAVYSCSGRPSSNEPGSVRIGDLYGEEEREFLIELKVSSSSSNRAHHVLSVRCCHKDPSTQELVYSRDLPLLVPRPHAVRSSSTNPTVERLRSLFFTTRAVAESRLLIERNNFTAAHQMLTSARALLVQSRSASADEFIRGLDVELTELQWRRQKLTAQTQTHTEEVQRRRANVTEREAAVFLDDKGEPLTPTSAWRAAERLAKVAIMRKSVNRVSDLHGFENARF